MKAQYQQFCQSEPGLPIFFQDWYLDAVCQEGEWGVATVEEGGKVKGIWTYFMKQKMGFKYVTMPNFVKFMGPYLPGNPSTTEQHQILAKLLAQIPRVASIKQDFHYSITNWLPLYWQNFQQTTRYTYLLNVSDLQKVLDEINRNIRRNIKKASEQITIEHWDDPERFYVVNKMSFDRQNIPIPYTLEQFLHHDAALNEHKQRKLFFAVDQLGQLHGASYVIWDDQVAYYHLAGDNPQFRQHGAGILLIWEAIQFLHNELGLKTLDFEGSMIKNVEAIRRQFGAIQTPYFSVSKNFSKTFNFLEKVRNLKGLFV
ncbi:GNAT family N-acetyltransferase [Haliscomenobacter sp.]|uniref:GNAT family N-acetyltransferase n=1 Tax=Haliscomenobacter sp. TaxID=2717303 RepID=UPI0035936E56